MSVGTMPSAHCDKPPTPNICDHFAGLDNPPSPITHTALDIDPFSCLSGTECACLAMNTPVAVPNLRNEQAAQGVGLGPDVWQSISGRTPRVKNLGHALEILAHKHASVDIHDPKARMSLNPSQVLSTCGEFLGNSALCLQCELCKEDHLQMQVDTTAFSMQHTVTEVLSKAWNPNFEPGKENPTFTVRRLAKKPKRVRNPGWNTNLTSGSLFYALTGRECRWI